VMWFARAPAKPVVEAVTKPTVTKPTVETTPVPSAQPQPAVVLPEAVVDERIVPAHKSMRRAPQDWLDEGNRLRAARRWQKAAAAYTRAAEEAPHTQVAYVARVAAAGVRLEHLHDAAGALASYRDALEEQPGGALGEEIDWGIAETLHALGRRDEERRALDRFVREHPRSPLLSQAKARLE